MALGCGSSQLDTGEVSCGADDHLAAYPPTESVTFTRTDRRAQGYSELMRVKAACYLAEPFVGGSAQARHSTTLS